MLLLFCIQLTKVCPGCSAPDVCPWCQTAAQLLNAVLNSLLLGPRTLPRSLSASTRVQVWAIRMPALTFAMIVQAACASTTSSSRCPGSRSRIRSGLAESIHSCKTLRLVFECYSDSAAHVSESCCSVVVGKRTEYGTTGNHVLVSHGSPTLSDVLPPSSQDFSDSFVAVFGQSKEELTKCQLLTVSRADYRALATERCRVNAAFGRTAVDQQRVDALPEQGVPQQFLECAVQIPEVERYTATRRGPGTIRDPLDAAQPGEATALRLWSGAVCQNHHERTQGLREDQDKRGQVREQHQ